MSRIRLREFVTEIYPSWGQTFLNQPPDQNFILYFNTVVIKAYILAHLLPCNIPAISAITLSLIMILLTALHRSVTKDDLLNATVWFGANFAFGYSWNLPSLIFAHAIISSFKDEMLEFFMDAFVVLGLAFFLVNSTEIWKDFNINFRLQRNLLIQYLVLQFVALFQFNQSYRYILSVISILLTSVMLSIYVDNPTNLFFYVISYDVCLLFFLYAFDGYTSKNVSRTTERSIRSPCVF